MLAQAEVEQEIIRIAALAEKVTQEIAKRAVYAAEADAAYKTGHAQAYLKADGPVAERDALAAVETQALYRDKRVAEARLLSAQEAGRNYRAQLDSLRSINSNLRALVSN